MSHLPKRAGARVVAGLKKFQPILQSAKARDVNESDTVVIVTDILHEIFGYDKYSEITSEHAIRGTFCDLAIKLDGTLSLLVEVKAVGIELKDQQVKQAVDYAANQGVDWVALTNGVEWQVYKVAFTKPIQHELVVDLDLGAINVRSADDLDLVGLLAKEGWQKARIGEYHSQRQALSRFVLGALIVSQPVLDVLRREVRRIAPDVRVDVGQIEDVLREEVLKRDVFDGEKAQVAQKQVAKAAAKLLKAKNEAATGRTRVDGGPATEVEAASAVAAQ